MPPPEGEMTPEAKVAFRRGQESTLLARHIAEDAASFGEIKAQLGEGTREMRGTREGLAALKEEFVKFRTEAETRAKAAREAAEAAKERAEGALQTKQFYIGCAAVVAAVIGILEGTGHG
jgi:hypothetical protein